MTGFLFGVVMTLTGAIALAIVSYFKGWLKNGMSRLLNSEQNRARAIVEQRLEQSKQLCESLFSLNQDYAWSPNGRTNSLVDELNRLPAGESQRQVEEMLRIMMETEQRAAEFRAHCLNIASQILPAAYKPTATFTSTQPAAPASASPTFRFKENEDWLIFDPKKGKYVQVETEVLNQLLDAGKVCGKDFFAVPESTFRGY